ncbi:hypothetical protein P8452_14870 [Trifolium repens]|nr:hypothetical protein P8452_14870 [Trifolium repens]
MLLDWVKLHHYCHLLQHTHFISISCICVHLRLLQHSSLKTRRSIKALSCHLKLSSLKIRKEKKMVVINSESSSNMDTSSESVEVCLGVIDMDMVDDMVADYVDTNLF